MRASLVLLSVLVCTGCTVPAQFTDSSCKSFKPIAASQKDTAETKRQVVGHNRVYDTLCPSKV
jgi:hypothetical protein